METPKFEFLESHNASYTVPFANASSLMLRGNWAENGADFPDPSLAIKGESYGLGATYSYSLKKFLGLNHEVSGGVDFKRSNNSLAFNQIRISNTTTDVIQGTLGYTASKMDKHGYWSGNLNLTLSPGDLSKHNNARDLASSGATDDSYEYAKVTLSRMQRLPKGFVGSVTATGQIASENLPGSEKIGAGGSTSLTGYDEREANGDRGFSLVADVTSPAVSPTQYLIGSKKDQLTFRFFIGYADVSSKFKTLNSTNPNISLLSFGPGFRYQFQDYLQASFDYGIQLKDSGNSLITREGDNQRAHFSLGVSW